MDLLGFVEHLRGMERAAWWRTMFDHPLVNLSSSAPAPWSATVAWRRHAERHSQSEHVQRVVAEVLEYRAMVSPAARIWWPDPPPVLERCPPDTSGYLYQLEAAGTLAGSLPRDCRGWVREAATSVAEALAMGVDVTYCGIVIYRADPARKVVPKAWKLGLCA